MNIAGIVILSSLALLVGLLVGFFALPALLWRRVKPRRQSGEAFSSLGVSVEVDCRACGQFNRVPSSRLLDRPKCGRCKARLLPGRRVSICHVTPISNPLSTKLNGVWKDEDRLWLCLANHLEQEAREQPKAPGASPQKAG